MIQIIVSEGNSGQRLDKMLFRLMESAPSGFLYKMLRKKNITLNGKKAVGNEILKRQDKITLFISEETYLKFGGIQFKEEQFKEEQFKEENEPKNKIGSGDASIPEIIYQDDNIIIFNKPAGMLSQKADPSDVSLVEYLNKYLLDSQVMTAQQMKLVKPAVCNRLDRNTSGIVIAGISLTGLQTVNRLIREKSLKKYYRCVVCGCIEEDGRLKGYLYKDRQKNLVTVSEVSDREGREKNPRFADLSYHVIARTDDLTYLEVQLLTGVSHQIRAQLADAGFPLLGDPKYQGAGCGRKYREYQISHGIKRQLLHACRVEFPEIEGRLSYLSGKKFCAPLPEDFGMILNVFKRRDLYGDMEFTRAERFDS